MRAVFSIAIFFVLGLSGCSSLSLRPDGSGGISETFVAPYSYDDAYQRADAAMRACYSKMGVGLWGGSLLVSGNLYPSTKSALVTGTVSPYTLLSAAISAQGSRRSRVTLRTTGINTWNMQALDRLHAAMVRTPVSCST